MSIADNLTLALDPCLFAEQVLGFVPDPWQAGVLRWSGKRLIMNVHRQGGKSTISSILALHTALYLPLSLVLLISPSLRQSSELFRLMTSFRDPMQLTLAEDNRLSCTFDNGSRIVSLPGSEVTTRGFSAPALIIEDEASRVRDELYYTLRPMLAVSAGRLVLMSTPFGKRGHFWEAWLSTNGLWERVRITADQCLRISPEFLEEERAAIGDWWFSQEYMCEFLDAQTAAFPHEMVQAAQSEEVETWTL